MQRRLAAILAADMVGYSRLMSVDEEGTHRRQSLLLDETLLPIFQTHQGRIVKTTGDGVLAEFSAVTDAVVCALDIQNAVTNMEQSRHIEQRIEYRIGINLGDIIIDNNDIFGDGVNIASRLEGLAKPGGICISDSVNSSIRSKLDIEFENYGEQYLKNISAIREVAMKQYVSIYRWNLRRQPAILTEYPQETKDSLNVMFEFWKTPACPQDDPSVS